MARSTGFTLIELLVVIAIIAILAAILFPVFITAKSKGQQAACMANMKQIGTAIYAYLDDNNDTYPPNRLKDPLMPSGAILNGSRFNWKTATQAYTRTKTDLWRCAANINSDWFDETGSAVSVPAQRFPIGYVYNGDFFNIFTPGDPRQTPRSMKVSDIPRPTKLILICEGQEKEPDIHPDQVVTLPTFNDYSRNKTVTGCRITLHHGNVTNVIFADTHAKTTKLVPTFVPVSMWHPDRGKQSFYTDIANKIPDAYR